MSVEAAAGPAAPSARRFASTRGLDRFQTVLVAVGVVVVAGLVGASALVSLAAPLALALFLVVMAAVWARPVVAAGVVVALAPAVAGINYSVGLPGLNGAMVLVVSCAVVTFFRRPDVWKRATATEAALLVFALIAALLAGYHAAVDGSSLASLLRAAAQPALLWLSFWVVHRTVASHADLRVVLRWALFASVVVSLIAIAQYFNVGGIQALLRQVANTGALPNSGSGPRITGPFPIWHSLCGYLVVPLVLSLSMLLTGSRAIAKRWQLVLVVAFQLVALVMAVTVTSFIWVAVATLFAAVLLRRFLRAVVILVVAAVVVTTAFSGVLQERLTQQTTAASGAGGGLLPQTVAYRVLVWQRDFLPLLRQAAGVGIGNDLPNTVLFDHTENQYFTWVLRGGVLLAVAGFAVLVVLFVQTMRTVAQMNEHREALATLAGVVLFTPAALLIWPYLTNAGLPLMLFSFAGAALGAGTRPGDDTPALLDLTIERSPR